MTYALNRDYPMSTHATRLLVVDPSTGEILASKLTGSEDGDAQVGPLLGQISVSQTNPVTARPSFVLGTWMPWMESAIVIPLGRTGAAPVVPW